MSDRATRLVSKAVFYACRMIVPAENRWPHVKSVNAIVG
jgi:hypothetical protein